MNQLSDLFQDNEYIEDVASNLLCSLQSVMKSFAETFDALFFVLLEKLETHVSYSIKAYDLELSVQN